MKRLFNICVLLSLIGSSCSHTTQEQDGIAKADTTLVKVLPLNQRMAGEEIKTSGAFTTDEEVALSFKNGGVIQRVYVKDGDTFKPGQLLASLNPTEINAGLEQAKLSEEKALRDYQRAKRLFEDSVATLEQMQNAETAYRVAQEQLRSARFNHNQTEIRATMAGVVLRRLANDGQVVGPGTPVLQVNNTAGHNWQLRVGLSDAQWAAVQVGDSALVQLDIVKGQALAAYVYKKSEGIDPASGTFQVMLRLRQAPSLSIGSGLFARASIFPRVETSAWTIPYDALLDGDAGEGYVFVTNDGKTAKRAKVGIGEVRQGQLLITAGLEGAQSLIISGSAYLTDGSPIKVVK